MTLDEHIKKAEEDAKQAEFDTEWGIGNYFIDRTEALEYAKECRQLAEWLKELKKLRKEQREVYENGYKEGHADGYDEGYAEVYKEVNADDE
jgi:flagellar biosynthesis/type III secretory pathway protein FliH